MAGIGFELKRILTKNSIVGKLRGVAYAAMITIGPLILVIMTLFSMYTLLGYGNVLFSSRELLASTILYIFIFSLCATTLFNAVISRYIADKIFENQEDDIIPAYYSSLVLNIGIAAIAGIVFCVREWYIGKVDALFVFFSYSAYLGLVFVFFNMLFVSALKEYKKIFAAFAVGMFVSLLLGVSLVKLFGVRIEMSVIVAFMTGFLIIGFSLFALINEYFKGNSGNYFEIFRYYKEHWRLILINTLYIFGLYIHNFIFWTTDLKIVVADSFVSAPVYDMATCIAMFINVSTMVIFIVQVETKFHDKYQEYCQYVLGGTGEDIDYSRVSLFRAIASELHFIIQLQVIFSISMYLICMFFLPYIGIGGLILKILPSLAVAYFIIFLMYCMIIFIFYFNIYNQAVITAAIFFVVTIIGTLISKNLPPSFYGLGVAVGAFAGFTYSFYAVKRLEKQLTYYIFCKGSIVSEKVDKNWGQTIFENKTI